VSFRRDSGDNRDVDDAEFNGEAQASYTSAPRAAKAAEEFARPDLLSEPTIRPVDDSEAMADSQQSALLEVSEEKNSSGKDGRYSA